MTSKKTALEQDEQLRTLQMMHTALMRQGGAITIVPTMTHGSGLQVMREGRRVGPLLLASEGQSVGDLAKILLDNIGPELSPGHG